MFNFLLNDRINPLVGNWVDEEKTRSQNESLNGEDQASSILNIFNKAKKQLQEQIEVTKKESDGDSLEGEKKD